MIILPLMVQSAACIQWTILFKIVWRQPLEGSELDYFFLSLIVVKIDKVKVWYSNFCSKLIILNFSDNKATKTPDLKGCVFDT